MGVMKDRMHTGELYLPGEPEIMEWQTECLDRLYDFNRTRPTEFAKREAMLKEMFAEKLGIDFEIEVISKKDFDKRYELIYGTTEEEEEYDDSSWDNLISTMPGIEIEQ